MAEIYFSGQGIVYVSSSYTSGTNALGFRDLGNVPSLKLELQTDVVQHKESRTGQRLTDLRLTRGVTAKITMTLESFNLANLAMLLYGTTTTDNAATVTAEVAPTGLVSGDMFSLAHPLVNAVTSVVDSAGSPATLSLGTDYTVTAGGLITVTSTITTFTQPLKTTYTYFTQSISPMFKQPPVERYLRFSGLNTTNANNPSVVELYRVIFDPVGNLDLINDDVDKFDLEGSVLYDSTRDLTAALGGFGRIITKV